MSSFSCIRFATWRDVASSRRCAVSACCRSAAFSPCKLWFVSNSAFPISPASDALERSSAISFNISGIERTGDDRSGDALRDNNGEETVFVFENSKVRA
jgi:hypothetical protein